jgi:hypothetical protein
MRPLRGILELEEQQPGEFAAARSTSLQSRDVGLGPPDLVSLAKSTSKQPAVRHFHHLSGHPVSGVDSVANYYKGLAKMRPKSPFRGFRYELCGADYYCFNSFTQTDFHFKIESGGKVAVLDADADDATWQQLKLSCVLRFWLAPSPIFRSFFNLEHAYYPGLRLVAPPALSGEDLTYIVQTHRPSEDVELAVALYLVGTVGSHIEELLTEVVQKFPAVLSFVWRLLPQKQAFVTRLAEKVYVSRPDDTQIAFLFVSACVADEQYDQAMPAIPLLLNTMWCCPFSCLAMARLFTKLNRIEDAFACLNAACCARQYQPSQSVELKDSVRFVTSKHSPAAPPNPIELEIIESQVSGLTFWLYKVTAELAIAVSLPRFRANYFGQFRTTEDIDSAIERASVPGTLVSVSDPDLDDLFDPGVHGETKVPAFARELPLCRRFVSVASQVLDQLTQDEMARSKQADVHDAKTLGLLALKLEDPALFDIVGSTLKKNKQFAMFADLVSARLNQPKAWQTLARMKEQKAKTMTATEFNTWTLFRSLAPGMSALAS